MYRYDEFDREMLEDRTSEFRLQTARRLAGEITEDQFKPLRLMNGLYLQLHAYMLRIAIPYGTLDTAQLRRLAHVARVYDKGYGHFTTRTNLQLHWLKLRDAPDAIESLAEVGLHAIQTSGNCIRNVTADPYAGAAADEIDDPRVWAEAIRQWSTVHPEFSYLPRKFKIAVTAAEKDRAAIRSYDIGLHLRRTRDGELSFEVMVGGGQGRTPYLAKTVREHLPAARLLSYLDAILRVYNRLSRRDNIHSSASRSWSPPSGSRNSRAWWRPNGPRSTAPRSICPTPNWPASAAASTCRPSSPSRRSRRCWRRPSSPIRSSPGSRGATCIRTRSPATRSCRSR